jgi:F0F1-type ATP synthase membrane subunit b/b'
MLAVVSAPAIVWVVVGLFTMSLLLVMLIGLVRQVKRLTGAVADFQKEIQPVLRDIQRDADRARSRAAAVQEEAEALRAAREGPRGGVTPARRGTGR